MQYKIEISKRIMSNPLRLETNTDFTIYGSVAYQPYGSNLKDYSLLDEEIKDTPIENLALVGLTMEEVYSIPVRYFNRVKVLNVWEINGDMSFMENFPNVKEIYIGTYFVNSRPEQRLLKLWDLKQNPLLEKLVIKDPEIEDLSALKDTNISHFEIERGGFYLEDDLPYKIYTDFSVFTTMKNLKTLKLWIEPIEDSYSNLIALSKLVNLEEIYLPKHYFTYNQFAYLKSKLVKAKGIEPFREYRNRGMERFEYMKIGREFPREFLPLTREELDREIDYFNELVEDYSIELVPPKF